ncbi:MAG: PKD domain-containing protein, partial [Bacteroidetes bacterium]|nr:PKD domain-containing protein [Bacteroidota bacterium]
VWDAQGNSNVNPNTPQNGIINSNTSKPLCLGTIVKDGRTFYIYQSPVQYTFSDDGAYKIKVTFNGTFVSDCGGFDVKYINVIVGHDDISINYDRVPVNDCFSKTIKLIDNSTGFAGTTIKTYIWDYGDNTKKDTIQSTQTGFPYPTPNSHTYPNNTIYYIKLTTINSIGGVTTDSLKVDLSLLTAPTFTISKDSTCPNAAIVFTPLTSTGADKWFWDYGDGSPIDSTTTQTLVSHSYTVEGIQTVSHWIKNSAGCPSSFTKDTVFVFHKPVANFLPPSGVCLPGTTLFTNTSDTTLGASSLPYTYHWDFGVAALTNDTSNIKNGTYAYTNPPGPGGYIVKLTAMSKYGCISDTSQKTITNVYGKPTAIVANTSSKKVCAGSTANFFDGSTAVGQTINSWYWNFGDGGIAVSQNPTYSGYTNNLLYNVKLVVGTDKGCISDTAIWTIKVNPKPKAATILPSSCITSGSLLFQDNSTLAVDDSVQTPYTWTWNFGDGPAIYTTKDSTHTYSAIGTYYITHSITTSNGCTDTRKDTFTISGSKPLPKYDIPNAGQMCNNQTLYLRDSSTIAIGTIKKVEIYWDYYNVLGLSIPVFTDNSPQNGVGNVTTKVYPYKYPTSSIGKNGIKVFVFTYNDNNCYSIDSITVNTYGSPKAIFDTIKGICLNTTPKLIKLARDSSGKFDNLAVAFKPVYSGNGVYNDSMFNPSVAGVGTHLIKVLYESKIPFFNHCKDSTYAPITVWGLPQPAIQVSNPTCEKNKITFTDKTPAVTGSGNITGWTWHFGEPSSGANDSSKVNPANHAYAGAGSYNVTLTATSDSGCVGTMATPLLVNVSPLPKVSFTPPSGTCPGSPSYFTSTSTISDTSKLSYLWNFGEPSSGANNTSTANPAGHTYGAGGPTDSIRLVVYSTNGCSDSLITKLGSLPTLPIIVPSYKIDGVLWDTNIVKKVCLGTAINFATAFKANDYSWVFGDSAGIINKGTTVAHTYPATNSYTGSFTTIDSNGCQTRAVPIKVEIVGLPNVDFTMSNPTCEKNSIAFTNSTTPGVGATSITSWLWNFGDPLSGANDSSKIKDPSHTYASYASYNVSLTATNDNGCKAIITAPKVVNVHPLPKVVFTNANGICAGSALNFTDNSTIADGTEAQFNYAWTFGDGATTSGIGNAGTSHTYTATPADSIRLIITSKDGCKDSLVKKLSATIFPKQSIKMSANNVAYNAATDTVKVCLGNVINFKNTNLPNPTKTYWDLGNPTGVVVNGSIQSYTYPAAQMYYGMHYADDDNNCRTDTINFKVLIWSLPTVAFDTALIKCEKSATVFTDKSVANYGSIVFWLWNFGDLASGANNSSIINPAPHTYNTYGSYDVTLKVTTSNGCSATLNPAKKIMVNPKPKANFVMQDTTCLPNATTFTSTSTIADGTTPVGHLWNFGDPASGLNNSSISNPTSHIYSSVSNYNVQLIVVSALGCADTTTPPKQLKSTSLHNAPIALYTVNTLSHDTPRVCVETPIIFKDASNNVKTSYWVWGDNGATIELGTLPAPQFGSTVAGTYYGQHYIDDNWGCRSQPTPIVTIIDAYPTVQGGTKYVLPNTPNLLNPTITNAANVIWKVTSPIGSLFDYLDDNTSETPICTPPTDITYLITATSEFGCPDTASYYVKLLKKPQIPTAFSPNGDGINDFWIIDNLKEYPGATVQVFDRYGQVVLNKFGYSSPWNGKKAGNGEDLPIGVYYYIIKPGLGLPLMTGYVTILR